MFRALEIGSVIDLDPGQLIAIERSTNTQSLALGGGGMVHVVGGDGLHPGPHRQLGQRHNLIDQPPLHHGARRHMPCGEH